MPSINLGRVGFVNQGAYIGGATPYKVNDIVAYNNGIFACIQAHSASHLPTDSLYWQIWASPTVLEETIHAPVASASITTIGTSGSGNTMHITGTTTITSFGVSTTGIRRTLIFDGILSITNNTISMILPAGANITTAAGDVMEVICENGASGYWRCSSYVVNTISQAEQSYLDGLISNAQTQITARLPIAGGSLTGAVNNTQIDKGTIASGTVAFTQSDGNVQRLQVGGALTIAVSGWATTGIFSDILLRLVNAGSATVTLSTINWIKPDGTLTTTFATYLTAIARPVLQTNGVDFMYLFTLDAGTTVYGKLL